VLAAGAATTGTGPHAGGKGAKRIPLGLEDMTRIHAEIVLTTGAVLLALLWMLWRSDAPARIQDSGRILLAVVVVQGIIGYTQFFTHLPAVLVGIHVFGATMVWSTALWFAFGTSDHLPESTDVRADLARSAAPGSEAPAPGLSAASAGGRDGTREPV
jgi:cytochrome c oxidase assembly protein subunit 15